MLVRSWSTSVLPHWSSLQDSMIFSIRSRKKSFKSLLWISEALRLAIAFEIDLKFASRLQSKGTGDLLISFLRML